MNERREMYKSYWAFEAGKWTITNNTDSYNYDLFAYDL